MAVEERPFSIGITKLYWRPPRLSCSWLTQTSNDPSPNARNTICYLYMAIETTHFDLNKHDTVNHRHYRYTIYLYFKHFQIQYPLLGILWCLLLCVSWWRHQMETFSALLPICAGNSPVSGEFPTQRPVTRSFDIFIDLRLNKRLSKQSCGWWFETLSCPLWRHCNVATNGSFNTVMPDQNRRHITDIFDCVFFTKF